MTGLRSARFPLSAIDVQLYRFCEDFSQALIYFQIVFSPWAFGTTQPWSIRIMNGAGFLLGLALLLKLAVRFLKGYRPLRWDSARSIGAKTQDVSPNEALPAKAFSAPNLTSALAILTIAILGYCLVSALNARATYDRLTASFVYHDHFIPWLPHSFDQAKTGSVFWNYLALACSFWAVRDWLLGYSTGEERALYQRADLQRFRSVSFFPARLRRLLWVLAINGALLGLEGIAQRLEGSGKLLFFLKPEINVEAVSQFGPYHYRSNAAQYFNLVWPLCLGFWWTLRRAFGSKRKYYHWLLVAALIMAACPVISTSRGGAITSLGILLLACLSLLAAHFLFSSPQNVDQKSRKFTGVLLFLFFTGALTLGFSLGWKALEPRLGQLGEGFEGREQMYQAARPMAVDYPWFGTGPGTFESVFGQLYRVSTETYWPAQLHNDWLETRITFGWIGTALFALAFVTVLFRWFVPSGIHGGRRFVLLIWLALAGCLLQARFDFPFQIYSLEFLFLLTCAILFTLSRRPVP